MAKDLQDEFSDALNDAFFTKSYEMQYCIHEAEKYKARCTDLEHKLAEANARAEKHKTLYYNCLVDTFNKMCAACDHRTLTLECCHPDFDELPECSCWMCPLLNGE